MDLVAGQKVKLQWLPCKVDHSGPANVGEYFKVKEGEIFAPRSNLIYLEHL